VGYIATIGGEESFALASTRGWHDFKVWVDTLPVEMYPDLIHLAEYGWSQELLDLHRQLLLAVAHKRPNDQVYRTAQNLEGYLLHRDPKAESIFVSDSMGEEFGDED